MTGRRPDQDPQIRPVLHRTRGFTLIELAIVLGLIALITSIAVPSFNALTAVDLRSTTSMVAGMIREAYARAAITGKVHRIVFDMDKGAFWIERTNDSFVLASEKQQADKDGKGVVKEDDDKDLSGSKSSSGFSSFGGGAKDSNNLMALLGGSAANIETMSGLNGGVGSRSTTMGFNADEDLEASLKAQLRKRASFSPAKDETGHPQKLEGDVRFLRVWTEHQRDAFSSGQAELYFFPTGFTERAFVTLSDDELGERSLTVKVNPLTARTSITPDPVEVPR